MSDLKTDARDYLESRAPINLTAMWKNVGCPEDKESWHYAVAFGRHTSVVEFADMETAFDYPWFLDVGKPVGSSDGQCNWDAMERAFANHASVVHGLDRETASELLHQAIQIYLFEHGDSEIESSPTWLGEADQLVADWIAASECVCSDCRQKAAPGTPKPTTEQRPKSNPQNED